MPTHKESINLSYSREELCKLILDVEKYPEFLPWCSKCKIINKKSEEHFFAELEVHYKHFKKSYISEIKVIKNDELIEIKVKMVKGPFKRLINIWKLTEKNNLTELEFFIDIELKSFALQLMLKALFNNVYKKMLESFQARAKEIYG